MDYLESPRNRYVGDPPQLPPDVDKSAVPVLTLQMYRDETLTVKLLVREPQ